MVPPQTSLIQVFLTLLIPLAFVSCLEQGKSQAELRSEIKDQANVLNRLSDELVEEEIKQAELVERGSRLDRMAELELIRKKVREEIRTLEEKVARIEGEKELTELSLKRLRALTRERVRRAWVGQTVDLTSTLGDGYEQARILAVEPTGLRIQLSSGVETVRLEEVPEELKLTLLMSEEEAAEYRGRLVEFAKARARRYQQWKEAQNEREGENDGEAVRERMAKIQAEIELIESRLDVRMRQISELKSKASAWELKSARAIEGAQKKRAIDNALVYRREADEIAEGNTRALKILDTLVKELTELTKTAKRDSPSGR